MKASVFRSYTSLSLHFILLTFFSSLVFLSCSDDEDDPAVPVMTSYDFPPEILDSIFIRDPDLSNSIRNVDELMNTIKQHGMAIHEGSNPPEMYSFNGSNRDGVKFYIDNECIFDNKIAENVGSQYGKYEETIRVIKNQQNRFVAEASYTSVENVNFPEFPGGLDRGSGKGFVSGSGNDFTIFYKVDDGVFENIGYRALWIISGTVTNPPQVQEVKNVTKCLVMLQKDNDDADKVANPGTIRIFRDTDPQWIQPEVVISGLTPESAFAGATVTITGSGFGATAGENTVLFGTVPATVQAASTTQLTVIAPEGPQGGGTVPVTVQVVEKISNSRSFIYPQPDVIINTLNPASGIAGTVVTITGSGFGAAPGENTVMFGAVPATVQTASPTQLTVIAPEGPQGGGTVQVTVQVAEKVSESSPFSYPQPDVVINTLSPTSGQAGTVVTITGSGFGATPSENMVMFGATRATVQSADTSRLTVIAPAGPQGGGTVQVTVKFKANTSNSRPFTYPQPGVVINTISPGSGKAGTPVTISGSGFGASPSENIVMFGATRATVQSADTSRLTVIAPAGPQGGGTVQVTVKFKANTSNSRPFTYPQPGVIILKLSPNSGQAGTLVTITGSGFGPAPAENTVMFGEEKATVQSADTSRLTVIAPAGPQGGGTVQVTVKFKANTSNSRPFIYPQADVVINTLNPGSGKAGTVVTISGSGFGATPSENTVMFGATRATVQSADTSRLTVIAPAGPQGGGTVQVTVKFKANTSNSRPFIYPQPDVIILKLSPNSGQAGTLVTITGSGFGPAPAENTVMFGEEKATVQSADTSRLTVIAPAGPQGGGTVPVTVKFGSNTSKSSPFIYSQPDVAISVIEGTLCIGRIVSIIGTGFSEKQGANTVSFRDVSGTVEVQAEVLAATPTQLRVQVPAVPTNQNKLPIPVLVSVQVQDKSSTASRVVDYFGLCEGKQP